MLDVRLLPVGGRVDDLARRGHCPDQLAGFPDELDTKATRLILQIAKRDKNALHVSEAAAADQLAVEFTDNSRDGRAVRFLAVIAIQILAGRPADDGPQALSLVSMLGTAASTVQGRGALAFSHIRASVLISPGKGNESVSKVSKILSSLT